MDNDKVKLTVQIKEDENGEQIFIMNPGNRTFVKGKRTRGRTAISALFPSANCGGASSVVNVQTGVIYLIFVNCGNSQSTVGEILPFSFVDKERGFGAHPNPLV